MASIRHYLVLGSRILRGILRESELGERREVRSKGLQQSERSGSASVGQGFLLCPKFRSWPPMPHGCLRGADILVCQLGRLSSRPRSRTGMSGKPAGWNACLTWLGAVSQTSTSEFRLNSLGGTSQVK